MKKIRFAIFVILSFAAAACAAAPAKTSKLTPMLVGQTADARYEKLWSAARYVTVQYFKIQKEDREKGIITTEPRTDRDASGSETKRGFITLVTAAGGYDVKVEIPYLSYEKYENVYGEKVQGGKRVLTVAKKPLKPPSKTDMYLESLIRSEIRKTAGLN